MDKVFIIKQRSEGQIRLHKVAECFNFELAARIMLTLDEMDPNTQIVVVNADNPNDFLLANYMPESFNAGAH